MTRPGLLYTMAVAAALVFGAAHLAAISGRAAFESLPSLNLATPPLADVTPIVGPGSPRLARRVVLVIIDGLRLDASYGRPFLDSLRARGIDAQATSHFPSLSRPNYVSIATGVEPRWSGVRTNDYSHPVRLDSLMTRVSAAGLTADYVSSASTSFVGMFGRDLADGALAPWPGGIGRAAATALAGNADLVVLLPNEVDDAGHAHGARSQEYRQAARQVDVMLGDVLSSLDFARDTVVVVADHGHIDSGGHGGTEPEVMNVPFILAGAGIEPGATLVGARLIDVAPTVAALLGVPAPGHALGHALVDALHIDPVARARIEAADAARHRRLLPILRVLRGEAETRAWESRLRRGALGVSLLSLLAALTIVCARRGIVRIDRRVLFIAVPAFPLTFYAMVLTFERFLTPSMLPAKDPFAMKLFAYGGIAAIVNLVGAWAVLSGRVVPRERLAAAAGLVLVGLVVALVPAAAAWALTDPTCAVNLPSERMLMLPPVTYSAVCCFAVSAALTIVVEYLVFMARASDPARLASQGR